MPFTGDEGTFMKRSDAKTLIQNHQISQKAGSVKGGFFGKNKIAAILDQPNCIGIRYYHAVRTVDNKPTPVIVIVGEDAAGAAMSDGLLLEEGPLCPPFCPKVNALDA